jgi:hypothetical protein
VDQQPVRRQGGRGRGADHVAVGPDRQERRSGHGDLRAVGDGQEGRQPGDRQEGRRRGVPARRLRLLRRRRGAVAEAGAQRLAGLAHHRRPSDVQAGRAGPPQGLDAGVPEPEGRRHRRRRRAGVGGRLPGGRSGRQRADQGQHQGQRAGRLRPRLHAAQDPQPRLRPGLSRGQGPHERQRLSRVPDPGVPPARVRGQRRGQPGPAHDRRQRRRHGQGQLLRRRRPAGRRRQLVGDRRRDQLLAAQPRGVDLRRVDAVVGLAPGVVGRRRGLRRAEDVEHTPRPTPPALTSCTSTSSAPPRRCR